MANDQTSGKSLATGIGIGIAIGAGFGVALHNLALGMGVGVALGLSVAGWASAIQARKATLKRQRKLLRTLRKI